MGVTNKNSGMVLLSPSQLWSTAGPSMLVVIRLEWRWKWRPRIVSGENLLPSRVFPPTFKIPSNVSCQWQIGIILDLVRRISRTLSLRAHKIRQLLQYDSINILCYLAILIMQID